MTKIKKELLRQGDIILFHTRGFSPFSMVIRNLTQSFWNHAGIYIDYRVIEALGNGVVSTYIDTYIDNPKYFLKIIRLKQEAFASQYEYDLGIKVACKRAREKISTKYDWGAIIFLGIKYGFKAFWNKGTKYVPKRFNPLQSREKFFCSELVCECFYGLSSLFDYLFQGETKQKCDTTTPKDIGKSQNVEFIMGEDYV